MQGSPGALRGKHNEASHHDNRPEEVSPTAEEFDVVVLGGGPGGYAAALYGASAGLRIAMVEEQRVGGTCLHRGCIPAKELLQTAEVLRTVQGRGRVRRRRAASRRSTCRRPRPASSRSSTGSRRASRRCSRAARSRSFPAPARSTADGRTIRVSDGTEVRGDAT